jgi:hypothetical protein
MAHFVPHHSTRTQGVPQYGYAVNSMGTMVDLVPQFDNMMSPATSAADYQAQQQRSATAAAVVSALSPSVPSSTPGADAALVAEAAAQRKNSQARTRTMAFLVIGGMLAYAAIAGGE